MKSQIVTSNKGRDGNRYLPYVFTEQGVTQLSTVLRSQTAIEVSIRIMDAFVAMRRFLIIDENVYLMGACVKDIGTSLCAITKMEMSAEVILSLLK